MKKRQVCPINLSHYRGSPHSIGNNLGTIPPEYHAKPCNKTEEKAKRANKMHVLSLFPKPWVGSSNLPRP